MDLVRLPPELFEIIITHVLPEGFESMAMTCKRIYVLCIPFIQRHNTLRSHLSRFSYRTLSKDLSPITDRYMDDPSLSIARASDLIKCIAAEPVIARYIRYADFTDDSLCLCASSSVFLKDGDCQEDVIGLFARCPYLKQAGLDWKKYLDKIQEELNVDSCLRYSQYAAPFLFTLLPNVERLTLPDFWKSLDATDKLIDAIVHGSKQSLPSCDRPSLSKVTRFQPCFSPMAFDFQKLGAASRFLALPHIRSFHGASCVANEEDNRSRLLKKPTYPFGESLESVFFSDGSLDDVGIADFLKDTKRLKTLRYSHPGFKFSAPCWDICKFVAAIEH